MAIVTALQFNQTSGALICDEEYWFLRRRRSYFLDNLRNLIPEEIAEATGLEAAYGGWGHPGFHEEVIRRTRQMLQDAYNNGPGEYGDNYPLQDIESIAMIVRQAMQDTRQRKINDMLRYLYGFTLDDLNRQFFQENGKQIDIKQDTIIAEAQKIVKYETKNAMTNAIFKNKAVVAGYDSIYDFRAFHLNAENTVCSLVSGGFEAIGAGHYGAGVEFSRIMNRLTLEERRQGLGPVRGIIALIEATLKGYEHFHEVGGGLNMIYINGEGKKHSERFFEFTDDVMHLAMEMVKAYVYGMLDQKSLYPLFESLFFKAKDPKKVEKDFFATVNDDATLRKLLRGYKLPPFEPFEPSVASTKPRSSKHSGGAQ